MISKLNENITLLVGGRNLEDFKTNETAVKQVFTSSSWRFCAMSIISDALKPPINFLPLRQKLFKTLQNEAIFPLITMNVLIYASNHFN